MGIFLLLAVYLLIRVNVGSKKQKRGRKRTGKPNKFDLHATDNLQSNSMFEFQWAAFCAWIHPKMKLVRRLLAAIYITDSSPFVSSANSSLPREHPCVVLVVLRLANQTIGIGVKVLKSGKLRRHLGMLGKVVVLVQVELRPANLVVVVGGGLLAILLPTK